MRREEIELLHLENYPCSYQTKSSLLRTQTVVLGPNKQTELFLVNINYYMFIDLHLYDPTTTT